MNRHGAKITIVISAPIRVNSECVFVSYYILNNHQTWKSKFLIIVHAVSNMINVTVLVTLLTYLSTKKI